MESFYLLVFLIGFALLLIVISHLKFRKEKPGPANPCPHFFRSIAAPYARQCRKCGLTMFREDANGNFPDGFREYFDYVQNYKPELGPYLKPEPREGTCYCGATMIINQDVGLGQIWYCEVCESWRKTSGQLAKDDQARTYRKRSEYADHHPDRHDNDSH